MKSMPTPALVNPAPPFSDGLVESEQPGSSLGLSPALSNEVNASIKDLSRLYAQVNQSLRTSDPSPRDEDRPLPQPQLFEPSESDRRWWAAETSRRRPMSSRKTDPSEAVRALAAYDRGLIPADVLDSILDRAEWSDADQLAAYGYV